MKKFLLSLAAVVLVGAFAMAEPVTVNFADETTAALLPKTESATPSTVKINGIDFEFMNNKKGAYSGASFLQISAKKVTPYGYVAFTLPDNCTKITITTGANASVAVKVSLLAGTNTINKDVQLNAKGADFAFEIPTDYQAAGTKYTLQVTNKYNAQISKVVFEMGQGGSSTLIDAGLAFDSETINATLGEAVPANALNKKTDAAVVYTSSNVEVATVDAATGEVTLVAAGTTTIKAATEATETYKAGEASYTLVVVDPNAKKPANLAFANATVSVDLSEAVPANALTKDTDAAVVYTSSNVEVATVDAATGEVTLVAAGTTTIKAATEATETYEAGEATYTLTVTDKADIVYENDGKTEASGFTFEAGEGENPWQFSDFGMTGNAFKITGKTADAYAVSPVFDLTNRIKPISITQTFAYNYITVAQIPEYFTIAVREEGATEWTVLTAAPAPEAMNKWTYVDDYAIDLGAYEGKKIQIGYHYVADGTVCGGWQIKNILVMGKKSSAVSDITVEDSDAPVVYYNMQGVRVANPANGLYIRVQGKKATKVLVR
mgnify:FL=1